MKKIILLFVIICVTISSAMASVLVIEGKYQDKNLYVQNGYTSNGVGFCTYEVTVNGKVSTDEVNSSAFEIDFMALQIKPGTSVIVEIKHKDDCNPKVLNPEALKSKATFDIIDIAIDKNGLLGWTTKNEMGSLPYIVEQFRWNKWIPVGEVKGSGNVDKNTYQFQTTAHSGENKFRVKQVGYGSLSRASKDITFMSTAGLPTYTIANDSKDISFSGETMYEVYDAYGNIVKRGYGNNLNIATLTKGSYYLCYDNSMTDFIR